jgi:hypothetical protein
MKYFVIGISLGLGLTLVVGTTVLLLFDNIMETIVKKINNSIDNIKMPPNSKSFEYNDGIITFKYLAKE